MNTWIPYAISTLALLVSIGTAIYTRHSADRREITKWKRDELLRATSELSQLSSHRQAVLLAAYESWLSPPTAHRFDPFNTSTTGGPHPVHSVAQMLMLVERIRLIDPEVAAAAARIAEAHRAAVAAADACPDPNDIVSQLEGLIAPVDRLRQLHEDLTVEFQRATHR